MATSPQLCRTISFTQLALPDNHRRLPPFRRAPPSTVRCTAVESEFDPKKFRHDLTRSDNYNRRGFGYKEETLQLMNR
ncbi:hypothetical protein PJJ92_29970, partial [Mycobacterium kansasii]